MIWLHILLAGIALGLWRAYDGSGKYLPGFWRGCIGVAVLLAIAWDAGALSLPMVWPPELDSLPLPACGVLLAAGLFWGLQRHMDDWSDAEYITPHFAMTAGIGGLPYTVWMTLQAHFAVWPFYVTFVALIAASGLLFVYQAGLFARWPKWQIGQIGFDAQRWTEFFSGFAHGAGAALLLNWAAVIRQLT